MDDFLKAQVRKFCDAWQGINMIYEDYARSLNMTYTSLHILTMIVQTPGCTQKIICEKTFLPKQTVNTIISYFYKKGLIELRELPEDRRTKTIHLTDAGKKYSDEIIPQIIEAEFRAMEKLSPEQRSALLEGMCIYCNEFRKEMLK